MERADEMSLRYVGQRSEPSHIQRLCVGPIHGIPGTQQAPVGLLYDLRHAHITADDVRAPAEVPRTGG